MSTLYVLAGIVLIGVGFSVALVGLANLNTKAHPPHKGSLSAWEEVVGAPGATEGNSTFSNVGGAGGGGSCRLARAAGDGAQGRAGATEGNSTFSNVGGAGGGGSAVYDNNGNAVGSAPCNNTGNGVGLGTSDQVSSGGAPK